MIMKQATIERRARERAEARLKQTRELRRRLAEKAKQDPDGIWQELLDSLDN